MHLQNYLTRVLLSLSFITLIKCSEIFSFSYALCGCGIAHEIFILITCNCDEQLFIDTYWLLKHSDNILTCAMGFILQHKLCIVGFDFFKSRGLGLNGNEIQHILGLNTNISVKHLFMP